MILDDNYNRYPVSYPFQITQFRSLNDHHWNDGYTFSGESHNFWEFSCVLEGEVELVCGEKIFLLKPGNFIACPSMVFHRSRSISSPCHCLNFSFEHTGTLPANLADGIFYLLFPEVEELKSIFYRLREACLQDPPDLDKGAEAAYALTSFLIRLSKQHKPHTLLVNSHSSEMYQKLVENMQASVYKNLTIQQIAARNAISVTTMKELFQKYAGIGPKAYYAQMRGNEALRLLKEGKEIIDVSEMLNCSSPNYFSYSFKKQFGLPPGQYRRLLLADHESL